jgi:hypothetical protein
VVESSGLLNRRRVKSSTGGSNPPLSARHFKGLQHARSTQNPLPAAWNCETGAFTALHFYSLVVTRPW